MAMVLITGGAGFVGSHTADLLIAEGHHVRVLDCLDPQVHGGGDEFPQYLHPDAERMKGDVRNANDVERALKGVDAVCHFASLTGVGQSMYDMRAYVETNCAGTANLIETIVKTRAPVKRFVMSSSRAVYGEGTAECSVHGKVYPDPRRHEDMAAGRFEATCPICGGEAKSIATGEDRPTAPASVYAWTKLQQEQYCQYAASTFGLPVRILRYFNVYGSRQSLKNPYTGIVAIFFSRIMAGQPISLYERGLPARDFVHVKDVARANVLALTADIKPGTCVNIGSGTGSTVAQIAAALDQACGTHATLTETGEFRVGDIRNCYADNSRALELLGFKPSVSLAAGMAEFVRWAAGQKSEDLYQKTVGELNAHGLFGRAAL